MKATEVCHPCKGVIHKVYIDGSATKVGASRYAGWGVWTPDGPRFNECGPLLGEEQGSDRAEVRVLVAALGKSEEIIEVITDNQSVRDTSQYLAAGGMVHKGKHSDLWNRIKSPVGELGHIRWVKAHLKEENAVVAGVNNDDWFGNKQADLKAKEGFYKHGCNPSQNKTLTDN
eukprot:8431633-Heterocapsa_arctica.AAC.1